MGLMKKTNSTGSISTTCCGQGKFAEIQIRFDNGCIMDVRLTKRGKLNVCHYAQDKKLIQQQTTVFSSTDKTIETKLTYK